MPSCAYPAGTAERIDRVCHVTELETVFQPLVDLESGDCVAYEALTRFPHDARWTPRDWFAHASALGLGEKLELAAVAAALTHLPDIPARAALAVNVSPAVAMTDEFFELVAPFAQRLLVELTEHEPVDDHAALADRLDDLRSLGARIAIDDVGAGFASVRDTFRLGPDVVKIDRSLTAALARDAFTRTIVAAVVEQARKSGVRVAAEGIESPAELEQVREIGIHHGQGFLLGRPMALAVAG
jgi:EAL domain-containing protein (putative c-di-GMP-specific phosphodiesterase class I)